MSYTITRKKRVVLIDATPDPRFSPSHITLFLEQSSANNVRPRSYEWTALATYRRMAWKKAYYPDQHEFIPANCGDFFDMLYVWMARQPGTGNLYLQDAEGDAFLGADPRKLDLAA